MARSTLFGVSLLAMFGAVAIVIGGQQSERPGGRGRYVGEGPGLALRRALAFHDMYAAPPDQEVLATRMSRAAERIDGRTRRALPINYDSFDPNFRLRPLLRQGQVHPGASMPPAGRAQSTPAGSAPSWTNIGPTNLAGRVSALVIDPTNPANIYRGTAGGGVWRSKDGGKSWTVLTDSLGNLSIGAIAIAPSQPATIYVGTGEGALGIDGIDGVGLLKSSDGGGTWGLPVAVSGRRFFALNVHPSSPNEVLAATLNGIQKSTDGGTTWKTTLKDLAATEIVRIAGAPTHLVATAWDVISAQPSWNGYIYRSTDDGETWVRVGGPGFAGFDADTGRMSLATSKTPTVLHALAASASGDIKNCPNSPVDQIGTFRSTDEGATWTFRSNPVSGSCPVADTDPGFDSILGGQGWYATTLRGDSTDAAVVYAGGLDLWKSSDGAMTWTKLSHWDLDPANSKYVHADIHALTFAAGTLLVGDDGGVQKTADGGKTFTSLNTGIVTRQYYSVAITPADRAFTIAGAQDNGTNIRTGSTSTYREVIGGDGFGVAVHPSNPKILYGTVYDSRIFRSADGGQTFGEVTPNFVQGEVRPFISPLTMDPNQPLTLYTGSNFLYKTTDGATSRSSWSKVSTTDLGDGTRRGYLTSIAVAKSDSQKILTATGSGTVKKSVNGGVQWSTLAGLPHAYASHVEFDPANTDVFYVSFMNAGPIPRLLKTTDGGQHFNRIDNGLPPFPIHVVRVDPKNASTLYVGIDVGLYISTDGGGTWNVAAQGLPAVSVWDMAIFPDGTLLRLASHGRGLFELLKAPAAPRGSHP